MIDEYDQQAARERVAVKRAGRRSVRQRAQERADEALRGALREAFPGQRIDQNRIDQITAYLLDHGHDVRRSA